MSSNIAIQKEAHDIFEQFTFFYQNYQHMPSSRLSSIYSDDVIFKDPVHVVEGLDALTHYFDDLSKNLASCTFTFIEQLVKDDAAHITWDMQFKHPKIGKGKTITLRGMTFIKFDDKIYYHEDCYDLGAMVYEHLPVLGNLTKTVKKKIG